MKNLRLFMLVLMLGLVLNACSSNKENAAEPEKNEPANEEKASGSDGEALSLGETGTVESTLGEYEITFESFQLLDELEDQNDEDEIFIVLDVTVNNIGDEPLEGKDLYTSKLFTDEGTSQEDTFYFESIDIMEGTIEPGDSMEGEFVFGARKSSKSFELVYNHALSSLATELTWKFNADEASN